MKKILLLVSMFLFVGMTAYSAVNVTFTVDMSIYKQNGYFNANTDTVRVAGDFNSWSTSATTLTKGTGADSSKYSVTVPNVASGTINYKFIYINSAGVQWENDPNRQAAIGSSNVVLPTVFFNNITGKKNFVWFKVDMSLPIKQGNVIPGTTNVYLAGDMTNWGTGAKLMTKGANDSVYSVLVDSMFSGTTHNFKFVYSAGPASSGTWEDDPNRTYMVPEQDSSVFQDYWNRVNPNIQTGTGKINFTLDMSVMIKCGIFNPAKDSVLISAGFNGWTTTDPTQFLAQNPVNDSLYFISHTFTNEPYGTKPYKYVVKIVNPVGVDTIWKDGYERPVFWGGGNKLALFQGEANRDTMDGYDGIHWDWFIPTGNNITVKFTVDMTPAMDPTKQPIPFVPGQDTLYWLSEEPAFARTQGWYRPSDGHMKILKMTPVSGSTNLYSGSFEVKTPAFNAFEYRYEWQKGSDGTWITEPAGFDAYAYRVRYIGQDAPNHFPTNPWNMRQDTWTNNNVKTDQEGDPYTSFTGVKDEGINPASYNLYQNYPNPFNPSTTIKFSVVKQELTVVKIYNLLGQEVYTIVNQELKPGTYSYKFDASKLSSGIYFYNIISGSFNQTKKMMLLK